MNDADYQAAAISAMTSPPPEQAAPTPPVEGKLAEAAPVKAEIPPKEGKSEEAKIEPKDAPSPTIRKSLEQVAREKAEARAMKEELKPLQVLSNRLGPQGMHEFTNAVVSGNTESILKALGISPTELRLQKERAESEQVNENPAEAKLQALEAKLQAFEQERAMERINSGRKQFLSNIAEVAKDPEFDLIADIPEAHEEALKLVEDYFQKHGELPGDTKEESFKLGLAEVQKRYEQEAKKFEKVSRKLTSRQAPASNTPGSPEQSTRAVSDVGRTLNNSNSTSSAPVRASPTPRSDEDYQLAAIAALKQMP